MLRNPTGLKLWPLLWLLVSTSSAQASAPMGSIVGSGGEGVTAASGQVTSAAPLNSTDPTEDGADDRCPPDLTQQPAQRGAPPGLSLQLPPTVTAGTSVKVSVTARHPAGDLDCGYNGTLHISSSDAGALLPADIRLTDGSATFALIFTSAGSHSVTATDTQESATTTRSAEVTVTAAAATRFSLGAPTHVAAGVPFVVTVIALDGFDNIARHYGGTLHLVSSDGAATLPMDTTLTDGCGSFTLSLATLGDQFLTATDNIATTGSSMPIRVAMPTASSGMVLESTAALLDSCNNHADNPANALHFDHHGDATAAYR